MCRKIWPFFVIGGILGGALGLGISMGLLSLPANPTGLVFLGIGTAVGAAVGAFIADCVTKFMR